MRVNVYAEEMTDRIEITSKEIEGHKFTGLRLYLALPAAYVRDPDGGIRPANPSDFAAVRQEDILYFAGQFLHRPGDDDSAAVTFWGKRDLRIVLRKMLAALDEHYGANAWGADASSIKDAAQAAAMMPCPVEPYHIQDSILFVRDFGGKTVLVKTNELGPNVIRALFGPHRKYLEQRWPRVAPTGELAGVDFCAVYDWLYQTAGEKVGAR